MGSVDDIWTFCILLFTFCEEEGNLAAVQLGMQSFPRCYLFSLMPGHLLQIKFWVFSDLWDDFNNKIFSLKSWLLWMGANLRYWKPYMWKILWYGRTLNSGILCIYWGIWCVHINSLLIQSNSYLARTSTF